METSRSHWDEQHQRCHCCCHYSRCVRSCSPLRLDVLLGPMGSTGHEPLPPLVNIPHHPSCSLPFYRQLFLSIHFSPILLRGPTRGPSRPTRLGRPPHLCRRLPAAIVPTLRPLAFDRYCRCRQNHPNMYAALVLCLRRTNCHAAFSGKPWLTWFKTLFLPPPPPSLRSAAAQVPVLSSATIDIRGLDGTPLEKGPLPCDLHGWWQVRRISRCVLAT